MRKLFPFILFLLFAQYTYGQKMSISEDEYSSYVLCSASTTMAPQPRLSISEASRIRRSDPFLALVPGAVQMRRKWPAVAGSIWGGMAVTAGLAIGEQINISRLEKDMANNPYATDWHLNQIRKAKKIRNGSLIALGGVYIANYITALLLPDRNPNTSWIALYADPQGAVGLTYALNF